MNYRAKDVLKEINNASTGELDRVVINSHHTPEDFSEGDIQERMDQFDYYHLVEINLNRLDREEFHVDDDLVEDYVEKIKNEGVENMPPMLISNNDEIIDGIHRLNALLDCGYEKFPVYIGSEKSLKEMLKKENRRRRKIN
jgi:ParB-like chromosome segregation protein Spo0J